MGSLAVALFIPLFAVSVIQLTAIQDRIIGERGWKALQHVRFLDVYWRDLSVAQRIRLWLGLGIFMAVILYFAISDLVRWVSR
jgi:hypothetical protein